MIRWSTLEVQKCRSAEVQKRENENDHPAKGDEFVCAGQHVRVSDRHSGHFEQVLEGREDGSRPLMKTLLPAPEPRKQGKKAGERPNSSVAH